MVPSLSNFKGPVPMVPVLSAHKKLKQDGKLLRRPLAPRILPALIHKEADQESIQLSGKDSLMKMFQSSFNVDALDGVDEDLDIPTDEESSDSSIVCPPPTSGAETRNNLNNQIKKGQGNIEANFLLKHPLQERDGFVISAKDVINNLHPANRGTHVTGKNFVMSQKTRGPDPLPVRVPKKRQENIMFYDTDDERYSKKPSFMLEHFLYKFADRSNLLFPQVKDIIYSKYNVKKLTDLIAQELNFGRQDSVHTSQFDLSSIPLKENRIPRRQLLYEMTALMKAHIQEEFGRDLKSLINFTPNGKHEFSNRQLSSDFEIILFQNDKAEKDRAATRSRQETEMPGEDTVLHSAYSRYFHGLQRSKSPISVSESQTISPSEMAVLESLSTGGTTLSFSAHFIMDLPDLSPLKFTLTDLNLCFNNFTVFPPEVLGLSNLEVLKMRNNPLVEISTDINRLWKLRVFIASFCLITALPKSLFDLPNLQDLSLAYNRLQFVPRDICRLTSLQILDLEGNQLPALPASCIAMEKLTQVNVGNNFMHPLFWLENSRNKVQSLMDLACVSVCRTRHVNNLQNMPGEIVKILLRHDVCDTCKGPMFGPGLRTIRPMSKLFSVKYLPLMFRACTPQCLNNFQNMSQEELCTLFYGE